MDSTNWSCISKLLVVTTCKHANSASYKLFSEVQAREDRIPAQMTKMQSNGGRKAVQIITSNKHTDAITLNTDAVEKVLLCKNIRDKPVVVVSVCGGYRQGKSFILDYFLRYLNAENSNKWLGNEDEPLTGFSWTGGCKSHTEGIQMWNQPFIKKTSSGEDVVVILLDTQVT